MVVNDSSQLKEARTFPQILSEAYARLLRRTPTNFTLSAFNPPYPWKQSSITKRLNFFGQLCNRRCSYMAKRVFNIRLTHFQLLHNQSLGFIPDINRKLTEYALHHVLDRYLSDGGISF